MGLTSEIISVIYSLTQIKIKKMENLICLHPIYVGFLILLVVVSLLQLLVYAVYEYSLKQYFKLYKENEPVGKTWLNQSQICKKILSISLIIMIFLTVVFIFSLHRIIPIDYDINKLKIVFEQRDIVLFLLSFALFTNVIVFFCFSFTVREHPV